MNDDGMRWQFENTKDTPLGMPSPDAVSRYKRMGYEPEDYFEHFPCFVGPKHIGRFMSLYECYKMTLGIAGHIAEVGVYRGACSMFLAKLTTLYEPHTLTQVHGFDMFERARPAANAEKGFSYDETYARVQELIAIQGLRRYLLLHQIDVISELEQFFERHPHLQFKLLFLDAGTYEIVTTALNQFWPRLTPGGIVVFDQFNAEVAPEETRAVKDFLPANSVIRTFPNGWMPTAYVVK